MRDGQRRTADVPAANGTSDKSKPRDKGILKAVVNIIDIIAHKLLRTDVWEQTDIDKVADGIKNEWCCPERTPAQTQRSPFRRQSVVQVLRRVRRVSTCASRSSQTSSGCPCFVSA